MTSAPASDHARTASTAAVGDVVHLGLARNGDGLVQDDDAELRRGGGSERSGNALALRLRDLAVRDTVASRRVHAEHEAIASFVARLQFWRRTPSGSAP